MERTTNKSQHRKLTLEKKILSPFLPGFELATFRSRVRRSCQQAIPAWPNMSKREIGGLLVCLNSFQLPGGLTGIFSGNCQETESRLVQACHTPRQTLKNILLVTLEDGRLRGRQRKGWMDNVKECVSLPTPELFTMTSHRKHWKRVSTESSSMSP